MTPIDLAALKEHPAWLILIDRLLERLWGKLSVIQPKQDRERIIRAALERVYADDHEHELPHIPDSAVAAFIQDFISLGPIEAFMQDSAVEDVMINGCEPIFVHRTGQGAVKTEARFTSIRELNLFVKQLHVFGGRPGLTLMSDVELVDMRGRANIIHAPFGPQITITRGKPSPMTILDLIRSGMLPPKLAGQLWVYVEGLGVRPCNILISGSTGSGKTTLMNALMSFFHPKDRLVTIEDTLELNTESVENCSRMVSSEQISIKDLVKNSLRMRSDRIVVGEVRGEEGQDLMTAMNLGKFCMGTLHAASSRETILRLQNEPMNIPPVMVSLVDIFIVAKKMHDGEQVFRSIVDVAETSGMEKDIVLLSQVWSYNTARRALIETAPSGTVRDRLAEMLGCSAKDIMDEVDRRGFILEQMAGSDAFPNLRSVTELCQRYITDQEAALKELDKKTGKKRLGLF